MSNRKPFISRANPVGDWGEAKVEDLYYDETTNHWEDEKDKSFELLGDMLGELLHWLIQGNQEGVDYRMLVFRKTIAFVWCIRPDLLGNKSLRNLAKCKGIDISVASLSRHTAQITKDFGRLHSGHKTESARKKYAKASRDRHAQKAKLGRKL
jgi:hypothetical protein